MGGEMGEVMGGVMVVNVVLIDAWQIYEDVARQVSY